MSSAPDQSRSSARASFLPEGGIRSCQKRFEQLGDDEVDAVVSGPGGEQLGNKRGGDVLLEELGGDDVPARIGEGAGGESGQGVGVVGGGVAKTHRNRMLRPGRDRPPH